MPDDMAISAALYLLGGKLSPSEVTRALKVQATEAWRSGDEIPWPDGRAPGQRKRGGWVLRVRGEGREPEAVLMLLLDQLGSEVQSAAKIDGVDEAFFDLFMAQDHGSPDSVVDLTPVLLARLAGTGLPLSLTFSSCDPPEDQRGSE